ncbi:hypothetical protein HK100_005259 [Physocladia obscura]|uniref:T6SS Phospholipase effector Tle1-like catalytic domain-containing protein n=1 Tax=Physocladia obscura TaxID=109957 RepID=A0AAD5X878_9FUNG|nr:hypothetical protein HK100_005259 [Physocladia obscura]
MRPTIVVAWAAAALTAVGPVSISAWGLDFLHPRAKAQSPQVVAAENKAVEDLDHLTVQEPESEFGVVGGGRKLVVFFYNEIPNYKSCVDGTWQYPGSAFDAPSQGGVKVTAGLSPSNIAKIAYLLTNGSNPHDLDQSTLTQKIYYHSGVATEVEDQKDHDLEGNFGNIHSHLLDAYAWLAKEYRHGDEIYAFGFSRGSTIVRSLFSFIRFAGLAHSDKFDDHASLMLRVNEAFDLYKSRLSDPTGHSAKMIEFKKRHCHTNTILKFIAVFDTVEALNVPSGYSKLVSSEYLTDIERAAGEIEPNEYHDLTISTQVQYAYHAISIDENRGYFPPTMFEKVDPAKLHPHGDREQRWFRGAHGDVGGGWWEHGLTDISLQWVISKARYAGLEIRDAEEFDKAFSPFLLGLDRDFYLTAKEVRLHDYFAAYPNGNSPMGKKHPRNLKDYMDQNKYFSSSLHESVLELKQLPVPEHLNEVIHT